MTSRIFKSHLWGTKLNAILAARNSASMTLSKIRVDGFTFDLAGGVSYFRAR
jgi:hypothetical protein